MSAVDPSSPAADPQDPIPPATNEATPARFAALQSRNFRLLWFGLLASNAGTWMGATAEGWLVTDLEPGQAAFWLGLISVSFAIPMLILPPIGGAIADRFSRLRVLWVVQSLYLLMTIAMAALTITGHATVWALVLFAFGNGIVLAFDSPVRHALVPDIVTKEQLTSAVSLNSVSFTGASLVGPAIAGLLIPIIGVGGVFAVDAVSCLATLGALAMFTNVPTHSIRSTPHEAVWLSIKRGVAYAVSVPTIAGLILVSTIYSLFARSYPPLLAVFARDIYDVGSTAYGILIAVGGLGALVGAFGLASRTEVRHKGRSIGLAMIAQSIVLIAFALAGSFWVALPLLFLVGVLSALAGALMTTVIQMTVANELRGRVMSLYLLTLIGVPSVGSFILGSVAEVTSTSVAVAAGSAIVILAVVVIFSRNSAIREA